MPPKITDPVAHFWSKVDKSGECWTWTGSRFVARGGYGQFHLRRRPLYAHRFSWELANGPIPSGMEICHRCDNPPCVRPDHLFLGTRLDNAADAVAKGRNAHHESHASAKLTESAAAEIRRRHRAGGVTAQKLADEFGITRGSIVDVLSGVTWR